MRAAGISICIAMLLVTTTVEAKGKAKHKAHTEEPAPEPAPEPAAETGWDNSKGDASDTSASDSAASSETPSRFSSSKNTDSEKPSGEGNERSENVAAIDAAADTSAKDDQKANEAPPTWWFGAYLQGVFVPSFMLGIFLQDPPTVGNAAFGVTATHRSKDGFSLVLGVGYTGYSFAGPLQKKGDPDQDTEWVNSTLGLVHLRGEMLWSSDIVDKLLSVEYGIGIDFGIVTGSMTRTEAYRNANGKFAPCVAVGIPDPIYCEPTVSGLPTDAYNAPKGAQYHVVEKRVPPVALVPMLPVLALRFTPVRNVAVKLEAAYGILQFAFGISAAYGVDL